MKAKKKEQGILDSFILFLCSCYLHKFGGQRKKPKIYFKLSQVDNGHWALWADR